MNTPPKSLSQRRVVVIAGAFAVLASAMTPAWAAVMREKAHMARKPAAASHRYGRGGGPFSVGWAFTAQLRP